MRKEDARQGAELRNDGFRKWTVTGKVFLQVSKLSTEKEHFLSYFDLCLHFSRADNDTIRDSLTKSNFSL